MTGTVTCSAGHTSASTDYCDQCGVKIDASPSVVGSGVVGSGVAAVATGAVATGAVSSGGAGAAGEVCPNCSFPRGGGLAFCEDCGYDFIAQAMPARATPGAGASGSPSAGSGAGPAVGGGGAAAGAPAAAGAAAACIVVVGVDRAFYDRVSDGSIPYPEGAAERAIEIGADEAEVLIGRASVRRGISPRIDMTGPPEDVAVSHEHAKLLRAADGTYEIMDIGSTNGTYLDDATDPLPPNTAVKVVSGSRIYLGAWTELTVVVR